MRHEVESSYTLIDIQQSIILVFMMLLALIFTLVTIQQKEEETKSPGDIIVQLYWDNSNAVDLDLWVQGPRDRGVGYSNPAGQIFNLLRDDLGTTADISGLNEEIAYTRGKPNGEYTINVHSYSSGTGSFPVLARVIVLQRLGKSTQQVWAGTFEFKSAGIEHTFVRFEVDNNQVNFQSLSFIPKGIRSQQ